MRDSVPALTSTLIPLCLSVHLTLHKKRPLIAQLDGHLGHLCALSANSFTKYPWCTIALPPSQLGPHGESSAGQGLALAGQGPRGHCCVNQSLFQQGPGDDTFTKMPIFLLFSSVVQNEVSPQASEHWLDLQDGFYESLLGSQVITPKGWNVGEEVQKNVW